MRKLFKQYFYHRFHLSFFFFLKLTSVFKIREGERIVCQRLKEIRDVAPVPQGFVCGHDGRATKRRDEPDTASVYRLVVFSVTFEQLRAGHITRMPACVKTTWVRTSHWQHAPPGSGATLLDRTPATQTSQPMREQGACPATKTSTTPLTTGHIFPRTAARADLTSV